MYQRIARDRIRIARDRIAQAKNRYNDEYYHSDDEFYSDDKEYNDNELILNNNESKIIFKSDDLNIINLLQPYNVKFNDVKFINTNIINNTLKILFTFDEILKKNNVQKNTENCINLNKYKLMLKKITSHIHLIYNSKKYTKNDCDDNYSVNTMLIKINRFFNKLIFNSILYEILNKIPQINITKLEFKNIKTKLYPYQIKNVNWMISIENTSYNHEKKLNNTENNTENIDKNLNNSENIDKKEQNIIEYNKNNIMFKGGSLFDEVGMGKTLQIITLINENTSIYSSRIKNNKLYSRGTLIIVPNHLCGQWKREFDTHVIKNLNIINLLTKNACKNYSIYDVSIADVVIISSKFFINCNINPTFTNNNFDIYTSIFSKCTCKNSKNCKCKYFNIYDYHWHRVVIDEYHEIEGTDIFQKFKLINSDYRWILSGTPLKERKIYDIRDITNTSLSNILDYVCFGDNIINKFDLTNIKDYEHILHHFSRNTHVDNMKILKLPEIVEEIIWLNFTDTERMIYNAEIIGDCEGNSNDYKTGNSYHEIRLRALCCDIFLSEKLNSLTDNTNVCDLNDMKKRIETLYVNECNAAIEKYDKLLERKDNIIFNMKELENENKLHLKSYSDYEDDLVKINNNISENLKHKNIKDNTLKYYKNFLEIISNKENIAKCQCVICLTEIDENDIGITTCNHMFCYTCISMILTTQGTSNKCPTCNKQLLMKDIFMISENKNEDINNMGTKLAYIINYIKKTPNKYRIIFSQWDNVLKKIGVRLTSNGIKNVFCKGQVFEKDSAIRLFNNSDEHNDCRVLMMSSKSTVSGSNLSNAEEVIFMDVFSGTKQERLNSEQQAIGRVRRLGNKFKTIKVLKLIIKQSIEEDIYKKNIEIDA